jgi:hypothetical protein
MQAERDNDEQQIRQRKDRTIQFPPPPALVTPGVKSVAHGGDHTNRAQNADELDQILRPIQKGTMNFKHIDEEGRVTCDEQNL